MNGDDEPIRAGDTELQAQSKTVRSYRKIALFGVLCTVCAALVQMLPEADRAEATDTALAVISGVAVLIVNANATEHARKS